MMTRAELRELPSWLFENGGVLTIWSWSITPHGLFDSEQPYGRSVLRINPDGHLRIGFSLQMFAPDKLRPRGKP